jgi:anti-sigma B factor antagonist
MYTDSQSKIFEHVAVLQPSNRFDAHQEMYVRNWTADRRQDGIHNLVIDLGAVNFVDSVALTLLVQEGQACRQQAGDLVLCNLAPAARIIFELTGLDQEFRIWPTLDEALAAVVPTSLI